MKKIGRLLLAFVLVAFWGCKALGPSISAYDNYSYMQTISLKVDALNLMDMATEEYKDHKTDIQHVQINLQKIYEYEVHRPRNEITAKQWQILTDTSGHLFGGFMIKWRNENKCGKSYIIEKKKQISFAFDQIAELESKKIKPSDIKN
ncbi:MAG: hypothetical protein ACXVPN_00325 [Bacteroidia bacterium]